LVRWCENMGTDIRVTKMVVPALLCFGPFRR